MNEEETLDTQAELIRDRKKMWIKLDDRSYLTCDSYNPVILVHFTSDKLLKDDGSYANHKMLYFQTYTGAIQTYVKRYISEQENVSSLEQVAELIDQKIADIKDIFSDKNKK